MDLNTLLQQLADGEFHSGAELGRKLAISRTAIWKQIKKLRELGLEIDSSAGRGYCLAEPLSLLDKNVILASISNRQALPADCVDIHLTTGSTNADALAKAQAGYSRYLVLAEHQDSGRGRRGRQWVSPLACNLYLSLLWSFEEGVGALEGLSLVTALAVARAVERLGYRDTGVKWPNDVLRDGRKLAGILLEIQGDVSGPCQVVIGIGLNINMPARLARAIEQPYSSLRADNAALVDRNEVAGCLLDELLKVLAVFAVEGFAPWVEEWQSRDVYLGRAVAIHSGNKVMQGVNKGVSKTGALLLETETGLCRIHGGEVIPSLRPLQE
ncbi:MAG: bifunctional biotin--[acetyl-CoA-carboxylase] ligase/biotin operon repressor BirA [Pseudomonadales bacterium]|nr:bifunctional biotin--[acetyl-CoA-carboxylase] ligase/biotin operon repressor BirA [Pseudomonadales bacterium]